MFILEGFKGKREWWRYVLVILIVFVGYNIGTIPMLMALWRSVANNPQLEQGDVQKFFENPDFGLFGIDSNLGLVLMLLMFVSALAVFYFIFRPVHGRQFKTVIRTEGSLDWGRIFFGFGLWLSFSLVFEVIGYFLAPDNYTFSLELKRFLPLVLICMLILPIQTSFEELFFRGYLMQAIGTARFSKVLMVVGSCIITYLAYKIIGLDFLPSSNNPNHASLARIAAQIGYVLLFAVLVWGSNNMFDREQSKSAPYNYKLVALVLTSILFGLIHSANPEIEKFGYGIMQVYYVSAGLFLGIMTLMDNRMELALGVHAATNFTGAVFVGYEGGAIQTYSLLKTTDLDPYLMTGGFFMLATLFLFIAKKKYGWGSFAQLNEPIYKPDENQALNHLLENGTTSNNSA